MKDHYTKHYSIDLNNLDLCVKGWNWGAAKFKGMSLDVLNVLYCHQSVPCVVNDVMSCCEVKG